MEDRLDIAFDNHIARVTLNRPDKYNALDLPMFLALDQAAKSLAARKDIRAIVLCGAGRGFCAGIDVKAFMHQPDLARQLIEKADDETANLAQRVGIGWQEVPVPVIAALHGNVFGGGLQIALGADMRLIGADTMMSIMEIKWGLVPDMSGTQTLRNLVGLDICKELTFTGRTVAADEAVRLGLATRICDDPIATATQLAHEIAARSPDAIRAAKRLLNGAWHADTALGLKLEAEAQMGLIGRPNQLEAVRANFERRAPDFDDD